MYYIFLLDFGRHNCIAFSGDGFISLDEITYVMTKTGDRIPESEVRAMLQQADADGDGLIDYKGMPCVCSHVHYGSIHTVAILETY